MSLLLLCVKGHARLACSVASALATVHCRCQPFAGSSSLQYFSQESFLPVDTSSRTTHRSRRRFSYQSKRVSHSRRRSSFPAKPLALQDKYRLRIVCGIHFAKAAGARMSLLLLCVKVTLGSPARLQAPSRRFTVAANLCPGFEFTSIFFRRSLFYLLTRRRGLRIVRGSVFLCKANASLIHAARSSSSRKAHGGPEL